MGCILHRLSDAHHNVGSHKPSQLAEHCIKRIPAEENVILKMMH